VICGIPGMGKSLLLREQAILAYEHQRTIHRLQWDIARQPFERADILARYPEIGGSTHPVIRRAAGVWVRRALARWFQTHEDSSHLLLVEAPLVGARFIELARVEADAAEGYLAADTTVFMVPVPSREVRAAIEAARVRQTAQPLHSQDAANAIPVVVEALWREVVDAARDLALTAAPYGSEYSPELYAALYRHILRNRHVSAVPISEVVSIAGSPHSFEQPTSELAPESTEVAPLIEETEGAGVDAAIRSSEAWYKL
jgi:hypothetical protein